MICKGEKNEIEERGWNLIWTDFAVEKKETEGEKESVVEGTWVVPYCTDVVCKRCICYRFNNIVANDNIL